jgi:hypothetical protein
VFGGLQPLAASLGSVHVEVMEQLTSEEMMNDEGEWYWGPGVPSRPFKIPNMNFVLSGARRGVRSGRYPG